MDKQLYIILNEGSPGERRLCMDCAVAMGLAAGSGQAKLPLVDAILKESAVDLADGTPKVSCPVCGLSAADFAMQGTFGCAACVGLFRSVSFRSRSRHGAAKRYAGKLALQPPGTTLRWQAFRDMEAAILNEDYESACILRDQLMRGGGQATGEASGRGTGASNGTVAGEAGGSAIGESSGRGTGASSGTVPEQGSARGRPAGDSAI
jgi:protein-arginine kinase activator protein McsA